MFLCLKTKHSNVDVSCVSNFSLRQTDSHREISCRAILLNCEVSLTKSVFECDSTISCMFFKYIEYWYLNLDHHLSTFGCFWDTYQTGKVRLNQLHTNVYTSDWWRFMIYFFLKHQVRLLKVDIFCGKKKPKQNVTICRLDSRCWLKGWPAESCIRLTDWHTDRYLIENYYPSACNEYWHNRLKKHLLFIWRILRVLIVVQIHKNLSPKKGRINGFT